jgi:hypothetical protein
MKTVIVTVCWACGKGGEYGPLYKVGKFDYAHPICTTREPSIKNKSFRKDTRLTSKDIKMIKKQEEEN